MKSDRKTVLITGSSRGIGRAAALEFANYGCRIAINCRQSISQLQELKQTLEDTYQAECLALPCDVSDPLQAEKMFQIIEEHWGGVDILVNNAGISHIGLLQDMTPEQWNTLLTTNLSSVFYCSRLAIPHMIAARSGRIINISSIWGSRGASCEAAYSASKGGIHAFTKALAKELAPSHISVNAIACGAIDTDMNRFLSNEERAALEEEIPAGRFGTAEEAARLIVQTAFAPEYLTGQIIGLDGGW